MAEYNIKKEPFRFWCQKILPLVYDDSLSYYELLCRVVDYLNKEMEDISTVTTDMQVLKEYVDNYFDNLDVQGIVQGIIDEMVDTGELQNMIADIGFETELNVSSNIPLTNGAVSKNIIPEKVTGNTIAMMYNGSYIAEPNALPSSFVFINDMLYAFDAVEQASNLGHLRVFDTANNVNVPEQEKDIRLQHANSACFNTNDNYVYIVPTWDFSSGGHERVNYLLQYDTAFDSFKVINTPSMAMGVSFDSVTGIMYYFDYDWNIYKYNESGESFTLYSAVNHTNINHPGTYNQDFCVHNNVFHISSPAGNILTGCLVEGTSYITKKSTIQHSDVFENYYIGELEGFEYFNGRLYAIVYTTMYGNWKTAMLMQMNIDGELDLDLTANYGKIHRSISINSTTALKFKLAPYELHSLAENSLIKNKPSRYVIGQTSGEFIDPVTTSIMINDPCDIGLAGPYALYALELGSGSFAIMPDSGFCTLTFNTTGNCISHTRASILKVGARAGFPMRVYTPNITAQNVPFIYIGSSGNVSFIRGSIEHALSQSLKVGSATCGTHTGFEMFIGGTLVNSYPAD